MGRVLGRIQIDRDAPRQAVPPTRVPLHDPLGKLTAHRIELGTAHAVLKPRDRRLRRQRRALDRIAIAQQLLDRIIGQTIRVVRIGIAARDPKDALRHEVVHRVRNLLGGATVGEAPRQRGGHAESGVRRFQ